MFNGKNILILESVIFINGYQKIAKKKQRLSKNNFKSTVNKRHTSKSSLNGRKNIGTM